MDSRSDGLSSDASAYQDSGGANVVSILAWWVILVFHFLVLMIFPNNTSMKAVNHEPVLQGVCSVPKCFQRS
jgi:hypothetical protein